jgi:hypothetical protein
MPRRGARPTEAEMQDQIEKADDHDKTLWRSMSYEQGVADALRWVMGEGESGPMDEE